MDLQTKPGGSKTSENLADIWPYLKIEQTNWHVSGPVQLRGDFGERVSPTLVVKKHVEVPDKNISVKNSCK